MGRTYQVYTKSIICRLKYGINSAGRYLAAP